jgi:hypothetical protein
MIIVSAIGVKEEKFKKATELEVFKMVIYLIY